MARRQSSRLSKIPEMTVRRLSVYTRCLQQLEEDGVRTVSSQELAERFSLNSAQVRKDLAYFGEFGVRGIGYYVAGLKAERWTMLGSAYLMPGYCDERMTFFLAEDLSPTDAHAELDESFDGHDRADAMVLLRRLRRPRQLRRRGPVAVGARRHATARANQLLGVRPSRLEVGADIGRFLSPLGARLPARGSLRLVLRVEAFLSRPERARTRITRRLAASPGPELSEGPRNGRPPAS